MALSSLKSNLLWSISGYCCRFDQNCISTTLDLIKVKKKELVFRKIHAYGSDIDLVHHLVFDKSDLINTSTPLKKFNLLDTELTLATETILPRL